MVLNDALRKCKNFNNKATQYSEFMFITSACCYQEQNVKTSHRSGYYAMAFMDHILKKSKYLLVIARPLDDLAMISQILTFLQIVGHDNHCKVAGHMEGSDIWFLIEK